MMQLIKKQKMMMSGIKSYVELFQEKKDKLITYGSGCKTGLAQAWIEKHLTPHQCPLVATMLITPLGKRWHWLLTDAFALFRG